MTWRLAADHCQRADPAELMNAHRPGQVCPIAYGNMTGQHGVIGQNHIVANLAVVGDMGIDHQQAIIADDRVAMFIQCPVDCNVFTNGIARADQYFARALGNVYVLRQSAQHGAFGHAVLRPSVVPSLITTRFSRMQSGPMVTFGSITQ